MRMGPWLIGLAILGGRGELAASDFPADKSQMQVGFGEADLTPRVGPKEPPVFIAGFGKNRKATGVHDPLRARALVLRHQEQKLALVSVDLVGLFHANVERIRKKLPGFSHVLVSSTHNHEGPDTLGLWGPNLLTSGVDRNYLEQVEAQVVAAVKKAEKSLQPAQARIGTAQGPDLLHDGRQPIVLHDELVALQFLPPKSEKPIGLVVQWNCHPETLSSKNTLISADYAGFTAQVLEKKYACPVVYLTGTVGGLLTSLHVPIKDAQGKDLKDGTFEKTQRYGELVAELSVQALGKAQAVKLTPFDLRSRLLYLPMDNPLYWLGWKSGVLEREAFAWIGQANKAGPLPEDPEGKRLCIRSELGFLRLGDLDIACIPGEVYPELVLGKVQDPPDKGADFPDAPIEPALYKQLTGKHRLLIGLANDEIGYIIPKRQWDQKAPYCYGRKKAQYGEENSLGPETAPILCRVFQELVAGKK